MTSIASGGRIRLTEQQSANFSTSALTNNKKEIFYKTEIMRQEAFSQSDIKNFKIFNFQENFDSKNLYMYGKFSGVIEREVSFFSDELLHNAEFYNALIEDLKVRKIADSSFFGRMGIKFGFIPISSIDMNFKLHLSTHSDADASLIQEAEMLDPDAPSPFKTVVLQSTKVNKIAKDFTIILKIFETPNAQSLIICYIFATVDLDQVGRAASLLESAGSKSLMKNAEHLFKSLSK